MVVGQQIQFFGANGYHANINVLNREMLLDAIGASGEVSAARDSRFGLRGQLRAIDPRAADECHQSHVPWCGVTMRPEEAATDVPLIGSPYDLRVSLGE